MRRLSEEMRQRRRKRHEDYRQQRMRIAWVEGIEEYGRVCWCCGQSLFTMLTIDHIDGRKDGHDSDRTGRKLWIMLKVAGWPKGEIQLLCASCNNSKMINGGICEHELERLSYEE